MKQAGENKITALALDGEKEKIAFSLGSAKIFLLSGKGKKEFLAYDPAEKKLPLFLQQHKVEILICNGIGNCTRELFSLLSIEVIAGVSGNAKDVLQKWENGTLKEGKNYSCTDHGKSCGACSGSF